MPHPTLKHISRRVLVLCSKNIYKILRLSFLRAHDIDFKHLFNEETILGAIFRIFYKRDETLSPTNVVSATHFTWIYIKK